MYKRGLPSSASNFTPQQLVTWQQNVKISDWMFLSALLSGTRGPQSFSDEKFHVHLDHLQILHSEVNTLKNYQTKRISDFNIS